MVKKNKRPALLIIVITTALIFGAAVSSYAQPVADGIIGENQRVEIFDGIAEILLKEGSKFFDSELLSAYYDSEPYDTEWFDYAQLWPVSPLENWFVDISYHRGGHMPEIGEVDYGRLLDYFKWERDDRVEFYIEPFFDREKHKLAWCVKLTYDSWQPVYYYIEIYFTRAGSMTVWFYCMQEDIDSGIIDYIRNAITILSGNTYMDFDPETDSLSNMDFDEFMSSWYSDDPFLRIYAVIGGAFIVSVFVGIILFIRVLKKLLKVKTPERPRKSLSRKEVYIDDNRNYYRQLRAEEDRHANKYADKYD